jgi:four helix bundle protein
MSDSQSFRDLKVWQRSMSLVEEIYGITSRFPRDERFGLNLANSKSCCFHPLEYRGGKAAKAAACIPQSSRYRSRLTRGVEVQLEIAKRGRFVSPTDYGRIQGIVEEVGRMLNGLIGSMRPPADW